MDVQDQHRRLEVAHQLDTLDAVVRRIHAETFAFELSAPGAAMPLRFVLNLPVEGMPEIRHAAMLETVLRNRDGFLRYLLLLLGEQDDSGGRGTVGSARWGEGWTASGVAETPLLEELVRAFSRSPDRLRDVDRTIKRLTARAGEQVEDIVPAEFLATWEVFREAMGGTSE